jgi:hypothetical protein
MSIPSALDIVASIVGGNQLLGSNTIDALLSFDIGNALRMVRSRAETQPGEMVKGALIMASPSAARKVVGRINWMRVGRKQLRVL